ncbi:unnamed protein product, partial [Dovyalis caffra]
MDQMQLTGQSNRICSSKYGVNYSKENAGKWATLFIAPFNNKVHPSMLFKGWVPVTSWESISSQPQKASKIFLFMKNQFPILFFFRTTK